MAVKVGSLLIEVAANVAKVDRDLQQISNRFNKFGSDTQRTLGKVATAFKGIVSIYAIKAVVNGLQSIVEKTIDTADQMRDFGRSIGIATDKLSGLEYAAKQSGVSTEQLRSGLQKMTKNVAEAAHGLGETGKLITNLGLNAKTLASQSPDKTFMDIVAALEKIKTPTDKALVAFKLFGKAGIDLVPLLGEGTGAINALIREAQRFGIIIKPEFADKADEAKDAINNLNASFLGLSITIAEKLVDPLTVSVNKLTELIQLGRQEPGELLKFLFLRNVIPGYGEEPGGVRHPVPPRPAWMTPPGLIELGDLSKGKTEAEKAKIAYEKSIDLMLKANDEERKLIIQADKWYEDSRKAQEQRDKEEAEVAKQTAEDKWKSIIGTQGKMSDEMIESYLTHLKDMGATEEELIKARFEVWRRHTDDWKKGMIVGLEEFRDSLGTETDQWADITRDAFDSMRTTAGDFASALMWDFDNIGESFRNMLKQMMMDITRTMMQRGLIDPLMDMLLGFGGGFLGDLFGGGSSATTGLVAHKGGVIKKYHAGGAVPGTGPSLGILQGGEYVIPKLHYGVNDTALQDLITQYQAPSFPMVNVPSGTISPWDIPQFGFYGSEFLKQYGIGAKPGASIGMPSYYYEKYGTGAEPKFMSEMLTGKASTGLTGAMSWAFGGGLPAALKGINTQDWPDPWYKEGVKQHTMEKGLGSYVEIMKALSGVGTGASPWLSMLPGVAPIPYPTTAEEAKKYLEKPLMDRRRMMPWAEEDIYGPGGLSGLKKHSGGLLADETMAILQAGEAVIPKRSVSMNRGLIDELISGGKKFHEGGVLGQGQSSSPHITINVENRGSNPVNVTQGPTVVSQGRILATLVIDEIRRNPSMRNALRG